ncbi:uncharacterized protein LOC134811208 [Bolinopsis microptera]|uniref:uncharacterized protein LOC134811208 n=1 Tax=Bolinopsis microptera TaxID=2820187 RepID=UPI00307923EA
MKFLSILELTVLILNTASKKDKWSSVRFDEPISADLEADYLYLKTGSAVKSGDNTSIWYLDEERNLAGGISILFSSTVKYKLLNCQQNYINFSTSLPAEQDKEWIIKKSGLKIIIYCNRKHVGKFEASPKMCDHVDYNGTDVSSNWNKYWERQASSIKFLHSNRLNTRSESYFIGCEAGKYRKSSTMQCTKCKDDQPNSVGKITCKLSPCAKDTNSEKELTNCECPPGHTQNLNKYLDGCVRCETGTYKKSHMTRCTKCDENSISAGGAESCFVCPPGTAPDHLNSQCGFTIVLSVALSVAVVSFLTTGVLVIIAARKCTCWNAVV